MSDSNHHLNLKLFTLFWLILVLPILGQPEFLTPFESPLTTTPGVTGNAGASREKNGAHNQCRLLFSDEGAFQDLDLAYVNSGWNMGFRTLDKGDTSILGLGNAQPLSKNLSVGVNLNYRWSGRHDTWVGDVGALWTPNPFLSAGYYTRGLWQSHLSQSKSQIAAVGIRPLSFSPPLSSRLMLEYQLLVPGVKLNDWNNLEHRAGIMARLTSWLQLTGHYNFNSGATAMGVSIQTSPHALIGGGLSQPDGGDATYEALIRVNKKIMPQYMAPLGQMVVLDLNTTIEEGETRHNWLNPNRKQGHENILRTLDQVLTLPGIKLLVVKTGRTRCGWAVAADIRERLVQIKNKGIEVLGYMESTNLLNYYLASACGRLAAHPSSYFDVQGFSSEILFYKGLMDKIGLSAQFVRHGKYKSYPEVFTRDSMSAEWRENLSGLLNSFWKHYLDVVAESRSLDRDSVERLFERGDISITGAQSAGLLDTLLQPDDLAKAMKYPKARLFSLRDKEKFNSNWYMGPDIALIRVDGSIMQGHSNPEGMFSASTTGSETLADQLKRARLSPNIKAVVLRINSPGGSAIASDIVYHQLRLFREAKKPIITSMGSACASGGYYIACGTDVIVTRENSVTGSIGIFGGKVVLKGLYEKLGLTTQTVKTAKYADASSTSRLWDDKELAAIQSYIDTFYNRFVEVVTTGRGLSTDSARFLAQGKVYTGLQAVKNGLADTLGGLETAIAIAKQKAGIPAHVKCNIIKYHTQNPLWDRAMARITQSPLSELQEKVHVFQANFEGTRFWALSPEAIVLGGGVGF